MRHELEQLLVIQDLELTLAETDILHARQPESCVERVRQEVELKRQIVDPNLLKRYDQLRRNGVAVVKESNGVCGGCCLNIPIGDLRRMHRKSIPWICPNCSRFVLLC